jgi:hypothetical protein
MISQEQDLSLVIGRLDRLERQNRWLKAAATAVLVLGGAVVLMAGQPQDKTGDPHQFVLRDEKGNERAFLGITKDGSALRFRDENGKDRLWLGLVKNTPGLIFFDNQGKRQAALSTAKRTASLTFYDGKENRRAFLVLNDQAAALHLLSERTSRHAGLSVEEEGVAVWHHDPTGKVHVGENSLKNVPGISLHGEAGDPLIRRHE